MNLLLLSNSRNPDSGYLEHARPWLEQLLAGASTMAFVPYAAVRFSHDDYEAMVQEALGGLVTVRSVHRSENPRDVVSDADAIAVGGGNTFRLVERLYATGLLPLIRERVIEGAPFVGWSAGSNVACPTMRTTNDMPIIEPPRFETLGLVPFQINPHYLDAHPDRHMGETREERLQEFCAINPNVHVVGLREGSALMVSGEAIRLLGNRPARIFRGSGPAVEITPAEDLGFLL